MHLFYSELEILIDTKTYKMRNIRSLRSGNKTTSSIGTKDYQTYLNYKKKAGSI